MRLFYSKVQSILFNFGHTPKLILVLFFFIPSWKRTCCVCGNDPFYSKCILHCIAINADILFTTSVLDRFDMQLLVFRARKTNMHVFYCRQVKSTFEDRFWKTKQKKYYNSSWPVLSILMPLAPRSCKCHFLFIAIHIMCLWRYCYISVLALFFSVSHTSISCSKQFCEKTKQKNYCFFFLSASSLGFGSEQMRFALFISREMEHW